MPSYAAPLRDMRFVLHELLEVPAQPFLADTSADVIDAILEEAAKLSSEVLQPLNRVGDLEGCTLENGVVRTPKGFKEAFKTFAEGGWTGLSCDPAYGGQGLPATIAIAVSEMMSSANMSFAMFPGLLRGAYSAIHHHGTDEQKALYLPKLVSGQWTGTMNLTEPHCGTDLGLIKTKAEPQANGSYRITGTKIFISAGEHDVAENIIHLVLARIVGAPAGVKGISLFIVPKFVVKPDGSLGARNGVTCVGLERKMGIHGNPTCVLAYENATGFLVGEADKGLRGMFTMMNEARLGVALQGLALSEVATQNAAAYARERLQGRSVSGAKAPDKPADPIIVHPDVRRMLMSARALNEGGRAFLYWAALNGDIARRSPDPKAREAAEDLLGLLTPVLKAYLTDQGFQSCCNAQQVFGGHGYIAEQGVEQFVRDSRISAIYEGTNGVQAMDLVGRKLGANGGRAIFGFFALLDRFLAETRDDAALKPWTDGMAAARADLDAATKWLLSNALSAPDSAGAVAMDYLNILALSALSLVWAKAVRVAQAKASGPDGEFYARKIKTARYFLDRVLPETAGHLAKLANGAAATMALEAEAF